MLAEDDVERLQELLDTVEERQAEQILEMAGNPEMAEASARAREREKQKVFSRSTTGS